VAPFNQRGINVSIKNVHLEESHSPDIAAIFATFMTIQLTRASIIAHFAMFADLEKALELIIVTACVVMRVSH
jgi:hypothetical protein